jgi:hypothetical protein
MTHRVFPRHVTDRLVELGLIEPKLGGWFVLTQQGRLIRTALL